MSNMLRRSQRLALKNKTYVRCTIRLTRPYRPRVCCGALLQNGRRCRQYKSKQTTTSIVKGCRWHRRPGPQSPQQQQGAQVADSNTAPLNVPASSSQQDNQSTGANSNGTTNNPVAPQTPMRFQIPGLLPTPVSAPPAGNGNTAHAQPHPTGNQAQHPSNPTASPSHNHSPTTSSPTGLFNDEETTLLPTTPPPTTTKQAPTAPLSIAFFWANETQESMATKAAAAKVDILNANQGTTHQQSHQEGTASPQLSSGSPQSSSDSDFRGDIIPEGLIRQAWRNSERGMFKLFSRAMRKEIENRGL